MRCRAQPVAGTLYAWVRATKVHGACGCLYKLGVLFLASILGPLTFGNSHKRLCECCDKDLQQVFLLAPGLVVGARSGACRGGMIFREGKLRPNPSCNETPLQQARCVCGRVFGRAVDFHFLAETQIQASKASLSRIGIN